MDIRELKSMEVGQLVQMASTLKVSTAGNLPRRELLLRVIRAHAESNGEIVAEGVLEKLADGYGFLRAPEASYLPGPDDIYVSPAQIRRFGLVHRRHGPRADPAAQAVGALLGAVPRRAGQRTQAPEKLRERILVRSPDADLPAKSACASSCRARTSRVVCWI